MAKLRDVRRLAKVVRKSCSVRLKVTLRKLIAVWATQVSGEDVGLNFLRVLSRHKRQKKRQGNFNGRTAEPSLRATLLARPPNDIRGLPDKNAPAPRARETKYAIAATLSH